MKSTIFKVAIAALIGLMPINAFAGELWLTMDKVRIYDMKSPVASIVVGNPAIADVTVQSDSRILLYGKTPGLTNIYFFDKDGKRVDNVNIRVQSSTGNMMVVNRGVDRATYTCTTKCELAPTVGDSQEVFGRVTQQAGMKNSSAIQAATETANR